ncbi:MAG: D-glycero-beta-D-manno-heptose 1-phosphate adenylyltransferase [Acidobacteria bacterium]|nr:MAG: D-glycero-beta-D-manno-heptose 1-phosphate adenylyltransferase [Acidobacteriota bacterium]
MKDEGRVSGGLFPSSFILHPSSSPSSFPFVLHDMSFLSTRSKIRTRLQLKEHLEHLRSEGKRIVFTNGCFDLLHPGHIRYLEKARAEGDALVVALNSDASVRRIKGPERPIQSETERSEVMAALECVDFVTLFDEPTPYEIIEDLLPDVLVKGGDWTVDRIVGRETVEAHGGKVISIPFETGQSTSNIIERIKASMQRTV